jgi:hypothetical protein
VRRRQFKLAIGFARIRSGRRRDVHDVQNRPRIREEL